MDHRRIIDDPMDTTVYSMERAKRNLGPHKQPSDWATTKSSTSSTSSSSTTTSTTTFSSSDVVDKNKYCRVTKTSVTLFGNINNNATDDMSECVRVFRDNTLRLPCSEFNDNIYGDMMPDVPTVLTGCCHDWKALHGGGNSNSEKDAEVTNTAKTTAPMTWTSVKNLAEVSERYRTQLVSLDGGPSFARESLCSAKVTLAEYARYCDNDADGDETPLYIFDSDFLKGTAFDQQHMKVKISQQQSSISSHDAKVDTCSNSNNNKRHDDLFSIPPCFSHDQMCYTNDRFRPLPPAWLLVGVTGSGTPIHNHPLTVAWNALLAGCKLWCCLPPHVVTEDILLLNNNKTEKNTGNGANGDGGSDDNDVYDDDDDGFILSALDWFHQCDYDNGSTNNPDEKNPHSYIIVQHPGEVVFVPAGWFHVVLNVQTSIAISVSLTLRKDLPRCMELLHAAEDDEFATFWKKELGLE